MAIDPNQISTTNLVPVTKNTSLGTSLDDVVLVSDSYAAGGAVTNVVTNNNVVLGDDSPINRPTIKQRSNKLHDYVNWTYQIGWYMLDIVSFNDFVTSGKDSPALRKHPIFKSGGIKEGGGTTGLDFDLGLRSLRLGGVIGNNRFSPNANQYDIEMEIVEPFGVSLLTKLRLLASSTQGENREFQVPYLIDIRWLGYDDNGKIVTNIPDCGPKLISCLITNVSFNITSSGTIYKITFAPYTQLPLSNTYGVIRTDTRLYGGTLDEVLRSGEDSLKAKLNAAGENDKKEGRCEFPDTYDFQILSYTDNGSTRTQDDKLAKAPMTFPADNAEATAEAQKDMEKPDPTKQFWHNTASSNVKDIIADLAKNSKYFQDLIMKPSISNSQGQELGLSATERRLANESIKKANDTKMGAMQLVKVIPQVKHIGKYDTIRGVFQKDILYTVVPYYLYGQVNPRTGQAKVASRGFVKEYNWIFTGKNQDVFNVDLTYDLLYFRMFQTAAGAKAWGDQSYVTESSTDGMVQAYPGGSAATYVTLAGDINARSNRGDKPNAVQEYFEQQLNPSYGNDMVLLDLDIIGDPDWIPQDRSVLPIGSSIDANNNGYVDGSYAKGISMDVDGVYVNINFRTPADYDDKSGLMKLSNDSALISGFYQVITVDSTFDDGKFTQKLGLVRVPSQEKNEVKGAAPAATQSSINLTPTPASPGAVSVAARQTNSLRDDVA